MQPKGPRIAVIGGGITGAFAAYYLARLGAQATIIERSEVAGHASGHNPGGLNPFHGPGIPGAMQALALESFRLHMREWSEIERLSGTGFGGRRLARIHVAMDDDDAAALAPIESLHHATTDFSAQWLSAEELRRVEPTLAADVLGGLLTEGNAHVNAALYTRSVVASALTLGADIVRAQALDVQHHGNRVTGLVLDHGSFPCDGLVIASGSWCAEPSRWLGVTLPIEPVKGELLLAAPSGGMPCADVTWRDVGVYNAAVAPPGTVWLGGTEEKIGHDEVPSSSAHECILDGVRHLMPGMGDCMILQQMAGLRPVTPDGAPIAGMVGNWENVFVSLGSGRKGMLLGSGLGRAAADVLIDGSTNLSLGACDPVRPELQARTE